MMIDYDHDQRQLRIHNILYKYMCIVYVWCLFTMFRLVDIYIKRSLLPYIFINNYVLYNFKY